MNVPTGMPLVYDLDENLKPTNRQYLGDPEKSGQGNGSGRQSGQSQIRRLETGFALRKIRIILSSWIPHQINPKN